MSISRNRKSGHGTTGRHPKRSFLDSLSGHDDPGKYGRMFPRLHSLDATEEKLTELANEMTDHNKPAQDNAKIPAGYTYLGQFIDHDITLDLTPLGDRDKDPTATQNFRTPALDLDSIYGLGRDGSPHQYARDIQNGSLSPKFLIGKNITVDFGDVQGNFQNDLPRSPQGFALIGDPRNDENLIVAQTHLAILKFHNKVVDYLLASKTPEKDIFDEARRLVTWHYQWIVLHDFLERIAGDGITDRILHEGRKFYRFKRVPYVPVEFSGAAYRFGHSMVRQKYNYNRIFADVGFDLLFGFSGLSGQITGDLAPNPPTAPLPVPRLPSNWIIDWRRFYDFGDASMSTNASRTIDPFIASELHNLPGNGGSLPARNLIRGTINLGLPSGQSVAQAMGIQNPVTPEEIASGPDGAVAKDLGLHEQTPLWFYILKEAAVREGGAKLGTVGATIVAEVLIGLVHGDHRSYLWQAGTRWRPTLPSAEEGNFTMVDLLRFVDDVSPIDGI